MLSNQNIANKIHQDMNRVYFNYFLDVMEKQSNELGVYFTNDNSETLPVSELFNFPAFMQRLTIHFAVARIARNNPLIKASKLIHWVKIDLEEDGYYGFYLLEYLQSLDNLNYRVKIKCDLSNIEFLNDENSRLNFINSILPHYGIYPDIVTVNIDENNIIDIDEIFKTAEMSDNFSSMSDNSSSNFDKFDKLINLTITNYLKSNFFSLEDFKYHVFYKFLFDKLYEYFDYCGRSLDDDLLVFIVPIQDFNYFRIGRNFKETNTAFYSDFIIPMCKILNKDDKLKKPENKFSLSSKKIIEGKKLKAIEFSLKNPLLHNCI